MRKPIFEGGTYAEKQRSTSPLADQSPVQVERKNSSIRGRRSLKEANYKLAMSCFPILKRNLRKTILTYFM